ncbi:MAG TPA: Gfo/Idh/MocA family oxidoreductase [Thermoanaerobaculia bacterium]|jgi:predicted dehydrogenase|nr:Gfo/Idh/MocA family oxidoreductase [Thermoanaerobaculia bacterium]
MKDNDPKLRLAVVGCGAVAAIHHLPALSLCRSAEAVVLVDADPGRARELAARFGVPETATDVRSLPGRVDAAIVALPNSLHAPVSIDLLRQGVHVLVEKPMALNVLECDAMIAAAETGRAVLAVGLEFRFFDSSLFVRNLLRDGLLGKIHRFEMHQGVIPRWPFATDFLLKKETAGGGVLADFGVHVLDLLLWWLGDWTDLEYRDDAQGGIESDCELLLTLGSGRRGADTGPVTGTIEISRTRNLANTCLFEGERASLEVGIWDPDPSIRLLLADREVALDGRARRPEGSGVDFLEAFVRQIDDFAAAVREGREPHVPGREGRRSQALIEECYARRQPLELPWSVVPVVSGDRKS